MNSIQNPEKQIVNDFIPSLNAFLVGELVIADHSVLLMFQSVKAPIESKVDFAKLLLERQLLTESSAISYLEKFINENTTPQIPKSIIQEIREELFSDLVGKITAKTKKIFKLS